MLTFGLVFTKTINLIS